MLAAQGPLRTWPSSRSPQREVTLTSSTWGPSPSRIRWAASAFFCREEREEGEDKLFLPLVTVTALCSSSPPVLKPLPTPLQGCHKSLPCLKAGGKVQLSLWTCRKAPRAKGSGTRAIMTLMHPSSAWEAIQIPDPSQGARRGDRTRYLCTAAV